MEKEKEKDKKKGFLKKYRQEKKRRRLKNMYFLSKNVTGNLEAIEAKKESDFEQPRKEKEQENKKEET